MVLNALHKVGYHTSKMSQTRTGKNSVIRPDLLITGSEQASPRRDYWEICLSLIDQTLTKWRELNKNIREGNTLAVSLLKAGRASGRISLHQP